MILEAQHISKKYSKRLVVDNLSISIEEGQIVGLLGPNGAGKTTFFYIIAGILNSDSGKVFINEKEITNQIVGPVQRNESIVNKQIPAIAPIKS